MLEIDHVKKQYNKDVVLRDISLNVKKGEVIVILGPSGCGKSTLLRCINGLESIQGGEIKLNGESTISSKHQIGMVFQSYELFPHMTVLQNLILGPTKVQKKPKQIAIEMAEKLLERVELYDKKDSYPRELSGGQKQRVAIARALALEPQVLLFDEVTAALDPEMIREVLDVILELAESGKTMLIVTHEMQFARAVADRIVFIDKGTIVESCSPEEFFTNPKTERARSFLNIFKFNKERRG